MKRMLIALLCVLVLLLAGCTDVNQTNSFVDQPTSNTGQAPEATPEDTQPPMVTLYEQPTPEPSPETSPEETSGFNG